MSRLRHPLIVASLVAVGAMLVLLALSPSWAARSIAADLRQRINTADEPAAATLVESLAALDSAGTPHLIELLDDSRPAVRQAARRGISQRLQAWSDEPSASNQQKIEQLASLLAQHKPHAEMHSRAFVKLMALKLLRCSDDITQTRRAQFLTACSTILERNLDGAAEQATTLPQPSTAREPFVFDPALPAHEVIPYEPYSLPVDDAGQVSDQGTAVEASESTSQPPAQIEAHEPRRIDLSDSAAAQVDDTAIRALPTRSLIRRLHDVPAIVAIAEEELRQRNFSDRTLAVARRLDDADPKVRQQLAEALPGLSGINAGPWLWELAEDDDENVRRAARNILATSSNPQTRARLSRLR